MVFKFILLYSMAPFVYMLVEFLFDVLVSVIRKHRPSNDKPLHQMFEDGELETELSFPEQYVLLSATDENGEHVEIEGLEDDFDRVDIERYKRKLKASRGDPSSVVLEI